jgi:hypothetical protein
MSEPRRLKPLWASAAWYRDIFYFTCLFTLLQLRSSCGSPVKRIVWLSNVRTELVTWGEQKHTILLEHGTGSCRYELVFPTWYLCILHEVWPWARNDKSRRISIFCTPYICQEAGLEAQNLQPTLDLYAPHKVSYAICYRVGLSAGMFRATAALYLPLNMSSCQTSLRMTWCQTFPCMTWC